jgi:hypothetical protein
MPRTFLWLVGAAVAALAAAGGAPAQVQDPVPAGSGGFVAPEDIRTPPAANAAPGALAAPTLVQPPPYVLPSPDLPPPVFPRPDLLVDRPYAPMPGWYANADLDVWFNVHLRNQVQVPVVNGVTGATDLVRFPGDKLDPAVAPRFEAGYRFEEGCGALQLGYRFLATRGSDQLVTGPEAVVQAPADEHGRLDYNILDFDYVSREYSLDACCWEMRWAVGMQFTTLYWDSRVRFVTPSPMPGDVLAQAETNSFWALGAHGVLDLSRKLPVPGLSAFFRMEATGSFGRQIQSGYEAVAGAAGGPDSLFLNRIHHTIGNPMASWILGLSYTVPGWNNSRFLLGYGYETWWEIGRVAENSSGAQLDTHGLFLRAEINF